jgi:superfamily II DNA helicase RecQ
VSNKKGSGMPNKKKQQDILNMLHSNDSIKKRKRSFENNKNNNKTTRHNVGNGIRSRHDATMFYALKNFWGYNTFRFQQQQIIRKALQGQDCFVIMPTGGGKSLCYQLPAIISSGVTIVVTPLVSLMQNQVSSLVNSKGGGIPAFAFHSSITEKQAKDAYRELAKIHPILKLIYVTPEKVAKSETFLEILDKLYDDGQLSRIVIDEAHCVSQWGKLCRAKKFILHALHFCILHFH